MDEGFNFDELIAAAGVPLPPKAKRPKRARIPPPRVVTRALKAVPEARNLTMRQQKVMVTRTGSLLRSMAVRLTKRNPCFILPFTLQQLRLHVVPAIGAPCGYCGKRLTSANFSLDHQKPVSRGGSSGLDNIEVTCKSCNTAKGEMTGVEFSRLLALLSEFESVVGADVLGRLKAGAAQIRLQFLKG